MPGILDILDFSVPWRMNASEVNTLDGLINKIQEAATTTSLTEYLR